MREGVEDGEDAVDGVEGEGGDGGDVSRREEGGLEEVEEEEGDAGVGEGEGAISSGFEGACAGLGSGEGSVEGCSKFQVGFGCCGWREVLVNAVFEADPGEEGYGDGEVEEAFVGDCEDDEEWSEGQEDDGEAVEIMVARSEGVKERHD